MKKYQIPYIVMLGLLIFNFQNCAPAEFTSEDKAQLKNSTQTIEDNLGEGETLGNGGTETNTNYEPNSNSEPHIHIHQCTQPPPDSPVPPIHTRVTIEVFNRQVIKSGKIDLVWVIDNSGSMKKEIQTVRDNFKSFLEHIASVSDLKFTLISEKGNDDRQVAINPELANDSNYFQIDEHISSHNGASTLISHLQPGTELRSHLRQDADKIVVFVTDDESDYGIADSEAQLKPSQDGASTQVTEYPNSFLQEYGKVLNTKKLKVFGFVGIESDRDCIADVGTSYIQASKKTGGKIYSVCAKDWSNSFNDIIKQVNYQSNYTFELEDSGAKMINFVKVNNIIIPSSLYQLNGNRLVVSFKVAHLLGVDSFKLKISYQTTEEAINLKSENLLVVNQ